MQDIVFHRRFALLDAQHENQGYHQEKRTDDHHHAVIIAAQLHNQTVKVGAYNSSQGGEEVVQTGKCANP